MNKTGDFQPSHSAHLQIAGEGHQDLSIEFSLTMMSMATWWSSLSARWSPSQIDSKFSDTNSGFSRWLVGLWTSIWEIIFRECNRAWEPQPWN